MPLLSLPWHEPLVAIGSLAAGIWLAIAVVRRVDRN